MGALECFNLSLHVMPTMTGIQHQNEYAIIKDYAADRGFDPLELLSICGRIREEIKK